MFIYDDSIHNILIKVKCFLNLQNIYEPLLSLKKSPYNYPTIHAS